MTLSTIKRVTPIAGAFRVWELLLSCGHSTYEKAAKKPSLWTGPEALGRRRKKRCEDCEWESVPGRTVTR